MSTTRRIHIPARRLTGGRVALTRGEARHLVTVLRLGDGARVTVFDGGGNELDATLDSGGRGRGAALVIEGPARAVRGSAAHLHVTLIQALIRNRNFELAVRKAVELGASRMVPVRTERTVKGAAAGCGRWRRIAAEASRQCGRADVMEIDDIRRFDDAVWGCAEAKKILAWEGGGAGGGRTPLADALDDYRGGGIAIAAGPEGGLTEYEVASAREAGFVPVSLGPRILRSETVPLALLSVLQYLHGDLSGRDRA